MTNACRGSTRETRQRGESGNEPGTLARGERLAKEKETEEGSDDETHLRDRHDHARLTSLQSFRKEDESANEQHRGDRRVIQGRSRRTDGAVEAGGKCGRERHGDQALRDD